METPQRASQQEYLNPASEAFMQSLHVQAIILDEMQKEGDFNRMLVWEEHFRKIFDNPSEVRFRQWVKNEDLKAVRRRVDEDLHLPHAA